MSPLSGRRGAVTQEENGVDKNFQENIVGQIVAAVLEVIPVMAMMECAYVGVEQSEGFLLSNEAVGLVWLTGSHDGMLAISTDQTLLSALVSRVIGLPEPELTQADLRDGVAELANMVSGKFKAGARLGDMGLSPPMAVVGQRFEAEWKTNQPTQILTFHVGEGVMQVSFTL